MVLTLMMVLFTTEFTAQETYSNNEVEFKTDYQVIDSAVTEFEDGWKDGYCEGWKDIKGPYAICPIPKIAPIPQIGRDLYKDGYNRGFKQGYMDAKRSEEYLKH